MAETPPYDILTGFPGWSTDFNLLWRKQYSRQQNGATITKDFGTPLWQATFQSKLLTPNELDHWKARINLLEDGGQTFKAWPTSRCFPIADPRGTIISGGSYSVTLASINANQKEATLAGLPASYVLSIGDYISIQADNFTSLHQLSSGAVANGSGVSGSFEFRPHLSPGVAVADPVVIVKPFCIMQMVPRSMTALAGTNGRASLTFQAIEFR